MTLTGPYPTLPQYCCHKQVGALKIKEVQLLDDHPAGEVVGKLIFEDPTYPPLALFAGYWEKHRPYAEGYYVVYADGYQSFSTKKAFEDGYTLIPTLPAAPLASTQEFVDPILTLAEQMHARWAGNLIAYSDGAAKAWAAMGREEREAWNDLACFAIHGGFQNLHGR